MAESLSLFRSLLASPLSPEDTIPVIEETSMTQTLILGGSLPMTRHSRRSTGTAQFATGPANGGNLSSQAEPGDRRPVKES